MTPITPLQVGEQFPAFSLESLTGSISNATFAGQEYLVYFYPRASTPGCTAQACNLQANLAVNAIPVPVVGVSPDLLPKIAKFQEKYGLEFPLLSDANLELAKACGVYGDKKFMGKVSQGVHRLAFVVDALGVVKHVFTNFKAKEFGDVVVQYYQSQATKS